MLQRLIVLQNDWATDAVFAVVNDETVKGRGGRFGNADLDRLWPDDRHRGRHPELLALLEKFEFCYRLPGNHGWLAPELLPPERPPALYDWGRPGDLSLIYHYDFLPKGIMSRLIVRENRYLDDPANAWRTGALFTSGPTDLFVEISSRNDEIVLRARGPERKELLSAVAADLDELNGTYGNLRKDHYVQVKVPCLCETCAQSTTPHYFARGTLVRQKNALGALVHRHLRALLRRGGDPRATRWGPATRRRPR